MSSSPRFHRLLVRTCLSGGIKIALLGLLSAPVAAQHSTSQQQTLDWNIPAQPLDDALRQYSRTAGVQVAVNAPDSAGLHSRAVNGNHTTEEALNLLLSGTGLVANPTGERTVTVSKGALADDGVIVTGTLSVDGSSRPPSTTSWDDSGTSVYTTPGSVAYIPYERIRSFPGNNAADILRGVAGVGSGESRNGGGLDINIRGLQGMGRVPVTVDGAMNQTSVYRGYQGMGGRSYIDPDLIGGVSIEKGPTNGAGVNGIGGAVRMRTIGADDIVQEGRKFGVRVNGSLVNNNTDSVYGKTGGWQRADSGYVPANADARPSTTDFSGWHGSIALGLKLEKVELVAAASRRTRGNYHAGEHGDGARVTQNEYGSYVHSGLTSYRAGEEILNTSSDSRSQFLKGLFRFGEGHSLEISGLHQESRQGEIQPISTAGLYTTQQEYLGRSSTDSYTARYHWKPEGNDLFDVKVNAWQSDLVDLRKNWESSLGINEYGSDTRLHGMDASNVSLFTPSALKAITLEYGLSYLGEDSRPDGVGVDVGSGVFRARDGSRHEASAFIKGGIDFNDTYALILGGRYTRFGSHGRNIRTGIVSPNTVPETFYHDSHFSPSATFQYRPFDGWMGYASFSRGIRFPSLVETSGAMNYEVNLDLAPEEAENKEVGISYEGRDLIGENDAFGFKLSYFHNDVKNYIIRSWRYEAGGPFIGIMSLSNADKAKFSGFDLSADYRLGKLELSFSGNYYQDIAYCKVDVGCADYAFGADFSNNYIPPKYTASLSAGYSFLDERLTIRSRITNTGTRAINGTGLDGGGTATFVYPIQWDKFTLVDLFMEYRLQNNLSVNFSVDNLTDRYYVEPLSMGRIPSPGRTLQVGFSAKF